MTTTQTPYSSVAKPSRNDPRALPIPTPITLLYSHDVADLPPHMEAWVPIPDFGLDLYMWYIHSMGDTVDKETVMRLIQPANAFLAFCNKQETDVLLTFFREASDCLNAEPQIDESVVMRLTAYLSRIRYGMHLDKQLLKFAGDFPKPILAGDDYDVDLAREIYAIVTLCKLLLPVTGALKQQAMKTAPLDVVADWCTAFIYNSMLGIAALAPAQQRVSHIIREAFTEYRGIDCLAKIDGRDVDLERYVWSELLLKRYLSVDLTPKNADPIAYTKSCVHHAIKKWIRAFQKGTGLRDFDAPLIKADRLAGLTNPLAVSFYTLCITHGVTTEMLHKKLREAYPAKTSDQIDTWRNNAWSVLNTNPENLTYRYYSHLIDVLFGLKITGLSLGLIDPLTPG